MSIDFLIENEKYLQSDSLKLFLAKFTVPTDGVVMSLCMKCKSLLVNSIKRGFHTFMCDFN